MLRYPFRADAGSNIFGGVLTSYAPSMFLQTRARNDKVRLAAVLLLEVIRRQGLVNPNEAVQRHHWKRLFYVVEFQLGILQSNAA